MRYGDSVAPGLAERSEMRTWIDTGVQGSSRVKGLRVGTARRLSTPTTISPGRARLCGLRAAMCSFYSPRFGTADRPERTS